jgi:hypothetical protein
MFATDQQRRWWFATHPEYSHGSKGEGAGKDKEEGEEPDKVSPIDVDDYVDAALEHETGPVADLLKSVKRWFGTRGESQITGPGLAESAGDGEGGWMTLTAHSSAGDLVVPRPPTLEEISKLPERLVRQLFRWLDVFYENNPLLIDPNALERHHQLPKAFINYFVDCGLNIEDFVIIITAAKHRLKSGKGVHTGEERGGDWNTEWEQFIKENPLTYTPKDRKRVEKKLERMKEKYGIR